MNILESIRNHFGSLVSKVTIEDEEGNVVTQEQLEQRMLQSLEGSLIKSHDLLDETILRFDETDQEFELKIQACDAVLLKGDNQEMSFNKKMLIEKRSKLLEKFTNEISEIEKGIKEIEESINKGDDEQLTIDEQIELLSKASEEKQAKVKKVMDEWKNGSLKSSSGQGVTDQKQAIAIALSEAGLSNKKKKKDDVDKAMGTGNTPGHEAPEGKNGQATSINAAAKSSVLVDQKFVKSENDELKKSESFEGHYANVIIRDRGKILFLKRTSTAAVAPGQYCLPGGHIEKDESIQQAASRELKEETNFDCSPDGLYIQSKAKADDGKWCFYLNCYGWKGQLALLDGEMENACWMNADEWLEADLFFDLKDHLIAMEIPQFDINKIPVLKKAELDQELEKAITSNGIDLDIVDDVLEKAKKIVHTAEQLKAHAQGTSDTQLRKVAKDKDQPNHLRDVAKKELGDRVKTDKKEKWGDIITQIETKAKKDKLNIKDLTSQLRDDLESEEENDKSKNVLEKQGA